jgi:hypothetical protein
MTPTDLPPKFQTEIGYLKRERSRLIRRRFGQIGFRFFFSIQHVFSETPTGDRDTEPRA